MSWQKGGRLTLILFAAALGLGVAILFGFLGWIKQPFDSFSHFRVHFSALLLFLSLALLATRLWPAGAAGIAVALLAFGTTRDIAAVPYIGLGTGALVAAQPDEPVYRLLQMNLRYDNDHKERVLSLIGRVKPDVVTLNEVSTPWAERLAAISGAYPYSVFCPFPNGIWGVGILSRRPFTSGTEPRCDQRGAFAVVSVDFGGRDLQVASLHLGWPWPFEQKWQISGLDRYLGTIGDPAILAGDMNSAPWSYSVRRVAEASGMRLMPSDGPTWMPLGWPEWLRFSGLPLDQVFAKPDVPVHSIRRLEPDGSDHLPVLVEFSLPQQAKAPGGDGQSATALEPAIASGG